MLTSLLLFLPVVFGVTIDHSIIGKLQEVNGATSSLMVEREVEVGYVLEGEGYHRELVASIAREGEGEGATDCVTIINVTSNFYIDLDQISQRIEFGGPDVVASSRVDTEQGAGDSDSHIVLVYCAIHGSETQVKVPLHFRYQATGSSPYSTTIVPTPHLLLRDPDGSISLPCSPTSHPSHCHWHPSPLTPSHPPLVAMVPVGLNNHTVPVVLATLALTFGSTLYLMHVIISHS